MKKSIKRRFILMFIGMMSIVLGISTGVLYLTINQSERSRILNEFDIALSNRIEDFNDIISAVYRCGFYVQDDSELVNTFYVDETREYEKNNVLSKIFTNISMIYEMNLEGKTNSYSTMFFVNKMLPCTDLMLPGSNCEISSVAQEFRLYTTEGIEAKEWFKKCIDANGQLYYFIEEDRLYISQKIVNEKRYGSEDKLLGVSLIAIDLNEILNLIHHIGGYQTAAAIMTDDEIILKTKNIPENEFIDDNDYINKRLKTDIGITFAVSIAKAQIGVTKKDILNTLSIYVVISVIIAMVLSVLFAKVYTRPVVKLAEMMRHVRCETKSNVHVNKVADDEIGVLYDSFNYMIDTVNNLLASVREELQKRYELEFRLYQNKISPHMLYNTLDSISWMALIEGNNKVVEMNSLLSEIYRYSVKYSNSMAPIKEELDCVKKYIELQQLRSDYTICLEIEDENGDEFFVPQFILQPLVENSIIHGYIDGMEELIIRISIIREADILKIIVEDNGKGCNSDEVNAHLKQNNNSNKIGMRNINSRIRLKFGEEYGIFAEDNYGKGTKIVILLPNVKS